MDTFGHVLYFIGVGTLICAGIWSFIVISRENAVLAVICLFLPMGLIVALLLRAQRPWRPLGLWMIGFTIFFFGISLLRPGS